MDSREQELLDDFEQLKPALIRWAKHVDSTLLRIIRRQYSDSGFIQMGPSYRCKGDKSLIDKAFHRDKNYTNPILEIEDKIATRIVVVTIDNVYKIKSIVTGYKYWNCKVTKDIYEINESNPNLFDYQSVHLVIHPLQVFQGKQKELLTCELQIRTLLQHSYAEVTHDSIYKGPYKSDSTIKRRLAKCMALMETTDDMFRSIFDIISMKGAEASAPKSYIINLISLYNRLLDRHISYEDIDIEFTDSVFELLNKYYVSIDELVEYCDSISEVITNGIEASESTIFNQPAILLIFYYAEVEPDFLKAEFRLNNTTLRQIMKAINLANDY